MSHFWWSFHFIKNTTICGIPVILDLFAMLFWCLQLQIRSWVGEVGLIYNHSNEVEQAANQAFLLAPHAESHPFSTQHADTSAEKRKKTSSNCPAHPMRAMKDFDSKSRPDKKRQSNYLK